MGGTAPPNIDWSVDLQPPASNLSSATSTRIFHSERPASLASGPAVNRTVLPLRPASGRATRNSVATIQDQAAEALERIYRDLDNIQRQVGRQIKTFNYRNPFTHQEDYVAFDQAARDRYLAADNEVTGCGESAWLPSCSRLLFEPPSECFLVMNGSVSLN